MIFFYCMFLATGKIDDVKTLKAAKNPSQCFALLLDEHLFTQNDVVFVQFLCRETSCMELYAECKKYALEHNALCFYESISGIFSIMIKFVLLINVD